jgi:hypothetical protein
MGIVCLFFKQKYRKTAYFQIIAIQGRYLGRLPLAKQWAWLGGATLIVLHRQDDDGIQSANGWSMGLGES